MFHLIKSLEERYQKEIIVHEEGKLLQNCKKKLIKKHPIILCNHLDDLFKCHISLLKNHKDTIPYSKVNNKFVEHDYTIRASRYFLHKVSKWHMNGSPNQILQEEDQKDV